MGWTLRHHQRSDKDLAGSASRAELTNLLQAFGRPLAEELAAQSSTTLQAAVTAQDALLAAQGRGMMQRTPKCGGIDWVVVSGRKSLPRQALQATMGHLSTLGRCLAFRTTLAQVNMPSACAPLQYSAVRPAHRALAVLCPSQL